jgi:hypothetical protein
MDVLALDSIPGPRVPVAYSLGSNLIKKACFHQVFRVKNDSFAGLCEEGICNVSKQEMIEYGRKNFARGNTG